MAANQSFIGNTLNLIILRLKWALACCYLIVLVVDLISLLLTGSSLLGLGVFILLLSKMALLGSRF
jgi:hypothetical protein